MVQRLKAEQIGPIIGDLAAQGMLDYRIPEPVSQEALIDFCTRAANSEGGRCYGWFGDDLTPQGFFVGVITPDPMTGVLTGVEFAWWAKPKAALDLLKTFEADCLEAGCVKVLLGASKFVEPERRRGLYERLGYQDHSSVMFKNL
jgi:hypothetical protein